nr:RNA-directed DNA polymerase, eukaryota, reverse transcriptase zinc-binding domain protein [Tanacetum cinerariifolium]
MSIFKALKGVLKELEAVRRQFFYGADHLDNKITWAAWNKILASKQKGGLGVSSFHALNRALLLKWVWRFVSQDGSLWSRVIQAIYGNTITNHQVHVASNWGSILREVNLLKEKGFDFLSHCSKRIGDGNSTRFWLDIWKGEKPFREVYPRLFALERDKEIHVTVKLASLIDSFRRPVRGGVELQQLTDLVSLMDSVVLCSSMTSLCLHIPSHRDGLDIFPLKLTCLHEEDIHHVLFRCEVATAVMRRVCRWWALDWQPWSSFSDWNAWFSNIRFFSKVKRVLKGVFCVAWWSLWKLRNRTIFDASPPSLSEIFDDIVSLSFIWCHYRCNRLFKWET